MSNMFKKTLVAAALTAFAASSHAVVVGTNLGTGPTANSPAIVSAEYVAAQTARTAAADRTITVPNGLVTLDLGSSVTYVNGDIIEISFTGANIVTSAAPSIARRATGASGITYQGIKTGTTNTYVFLVSDAAAVNEFVAADTPPVVGVNGKALELRGVVLQSTGLSNSVSVAYRATNSAGNVEKDNFGTQSRQVLDVRSQFALEVTEKLDAKVKPSSRHELSTGTTDTFKVKVTNLSGGNWASTLRLADATRLNLVAKGDFAAFSTATTAYNPLKCADSGFVTGFADGALTATQKTVSFEKDTIGAGGTAAVEVTCTMDVAASVVGKPLPLTPFTLDASLTTGATPPVTRISLTGSDVGQFTLDASSVVVPYMPFGDNITHVINMTNSSNFSGAVTVEAIDRTGKKYGPVSVGNVAAGTQVALADAVKAALLGAGMPANERAQLTFVVTATSGIQLYSAYNVGGTGARIVVNSSNGK